MQIPFGFIILFAVAVLIIGTVLLAMILTQVKKIKYYVKFLSQITQTGVVCKPMYLDVPNAQKTRVE